MILRAAESIDAAMALHREVIELSDYETAQKSLAGMRRVLQLISGKNGLPDSARHWYAERHWPVDMALEQKWRAAIDALKSDAHAALPE